jgi:hypothetical protein
MRLERLAVSALLCGSIGCGGSSSPTATPTPTPPARAAVHVLIDPNPVTAVPSGDPAYPWAFTVNVQLSDSGGVAFIVTSMLTTITAASTGETWLSSSENPFVGAKIPAYGQTTLQMRMSSYRMDWAKTREGTLTFKMNFVDDNGYPSTYEGSARIQSVGSPSHLQR